MSKPSLVTHMEQIEEGDVMSTIFDIKEKKKTFHYTINKQKKVASM